MKNILILTIVTLLLGGCGSSSDGDSGGNPDVPGITPDRGDTSMIMNQQYVVSQGDQIFKDSNFAKVKIIHTDGNTQSTVELIEGSATLRNN